MQKINKVKIFYNSNDVSQKVYRTLVKKLVDSGLEIVESEQQLNIAIGGDGAFIRMLKQNDYNSIMLYVGINTGTLGFLQEIEVEEIDDLIESLKYANYKVCSTAIQKNIIKTSSGKTKHYAFNEIVIRRQDLSLTKLDVTVQDEHIERFVGDALMVTTSVGSTAHASSYGSAVIHDSFHAMQLVPVGAFNSVINQTFKNPLILPINVVINISPLEGSDHLTITIDGENYNFENIQKITTSICSKKIKRLRLNNKNFYKKLKSKFIDINN